MTHIELHAIKFIRVYSLKGFFCPVLDFRKKIRVWSTGSETSKGLENCYSFNSLFQTERFFHKESLSGLKTFYMQIHILKLFWPKNSVFTYFSPNLSFTLNWGQNDQGFPKGFEYWIFFEKIKGSEYTGYFEKKTL